MLCLKQYEARSYDKELNELAKKHGFESFEKLLRCRNYVLILKAVKQALFRNAVDETMNLQNEIHELKNDLSDLRLYLE